MNKSVKSFLVSLLCIFSALPSGQIASAAGPIDCTITLISPVLTSTNTSEAAKNQKLADGWVGQTWFGEGLIFQRTFAPVGTTVNLTYRVTAKNGSPVGNQNVTLRVGKGYSKSSAIARVDGVTTKGTSKEAPIDLARIVHKTDAYGIVTFALENLDTVGEPEPASFTDKPVITEEAADDDYHMQVLPEIAGEKDDHSVITEIHYYNPKSTSTTPANVTIKRLAPQLNATDSVQSSSAVTQTHLPAGSKFILAYEVTDSAKMPVRGAKIQLDVNTSTSNGNAELIIGTTKLKSGLVTAITDSFGVAVFSITNLDLKGGPKPSSPNSSPVTSGGRFASFHPFVNSKTADQSLATEVFFYGEATASVKITASSPKAGSVLLGISGATGKSATISIPGQASKEVSVTISNQGFSLKATKGSKTITVTIDGKKYLAKVVVK